MRAAAGIPGHVIRERLRRFMQGSAWHRRLIVATLIVGAQAAVLSVTYRAVILDNRTLLTGSVVSGTEGASPPYGYPGAVPTSWNEVDAGASAWQLVPQIRKAHAEISEGQLPLWNANVMLGAPLAAAVQNGLFNPFTWPLVAHPTTSVWDAWLLTRLLMAGVLASALALYLGLRAGPATVAGLVYMMSGVFQLRTTTIQTGAMALLPLLILAAEYCVRRPSRRSSGLLAVTVAATILVGMPEESFLCVAVGALYFGVRFAAEWSRNRQNARVLYAGLGGGLVGILFSLPLIIPLLEYLGVGWTIHGPDARDALQLQDAGQLLRIVGPHWTGGGPYFQVGFAPVDNWFGIGAIFVALLGAFTRVFPRGVRAFLALIAVLIEAKEVGFPGWFNQLVGNTPILSRITLAAYASVFVSLAVALFAGAGFQRIVLGAVKARHAIALGLVLAGTVAAAAPAFLAGRTVAWSELALTAAVLMVVVAGTRLAALTARRPHVLGVLMTVVAVSAELILLATPAIPLAIRYDPLSPTPTTVYLQRVMPSGTGRSYSATQILYPTTSQAFNIDDVRNLDAIYIERTYRYLKLFVVPGLFDRFDGLNVDAAVFIHNPFVNALNLKYILVAPTSADPAYLPADQFTLEAVAADGVRIYRNRDVAPRAQVFFDVTTATSESDAAAFMSQSGFDPTRSAVVEIGRSLPTRREPPTPAHIDSYSDSRVVVTSTTSEPGTLVLADAYYPGWQAEMDGRPTTIYPVDVALRGVQVPAGTHTVTMQYRPRSVEIGALGVPAGLIAFGLGGWALPAALRVKRRPPPAGVQGFR